MVKCFLPSSNEHQLRIVLSYCPAIKYLLNITYEIIRNHSHETCPKTITNTDDSSLTSPALPVDPWPRYPLSSLLGGFECVRHDEHISYGSLGDSVPPFGLAFSSGNTPIHDILSPDDTQQSYEPLPFIRLNGCISLQQGTCRTSSRQLMKKALLGSTTRRAGKSHLLKVRIKIFFSLNISVVRKTSD